MQLRGKNEEDGNGEWEGGAARPGGGPAPRGFSAQLRGAGLWDLVQMECLARSRRVVQVIGEGGVGYLYFDRGQLAHATTAQRSGEAAALEILGWTNGSFLSCDRPWPPQATIRTSPEGLILQVAQQRDEAGASNLVAFPGRSGSGDDADRYEELELTEVGETVPEEGVTEMRGAGSDEAAATPKSGGGGAPSGRAELGAGGEFSVMLRLGPNGAVIGNRGGSDELADATAYVHRLLELTGELLGFEKLTAVECGFFGGERFIVFSEGDEVVALRPRPMFNLQALRERLGL